MKYILTLIRYVKSNFPHWVLPRMEDILFVTLLFSTSLQAPLMLNTDGDLGRHITVGTYMLDNSKIITRDIFSHTMTGQRIIPHEWLAQLAFGGVYKLAGLSGIILLVSFLIAITFTLTYQAMLKKNMFHSVAFIVTTLAAAASSLHWLARPHVFTFLFVALWTHQLENKAAKIWQFPLIMLLWANTHGAFIAGFAIWGAFFAGWLWDFLRKEETKFTGIRLLNIGITSIVVTFINPAGRHLWNTSIGYFGSRFLIDKTIEYQSPNFHMSSTWPFLAMLILFFLIYGFGGKLKMHETLLLAGWGALSLYNARNIPIFAIVSAPYLGHLIQEIIKGLPAIDRIEQNLVNIQRNLRGYALSGLAIIFLLVTTQSNPEVRFNPNIFPIDAANWLEVNRQKGNMYNFFTWGGYLLYRLWPEQQVFIDGQTDFYGEELSREYVQIESLQPGWEDILTKYHVEWVIMQPEQPLVNALATKGWLTLYQDHTAVILRKPND